MGLVTPKAGSARVLGSEVRDRRAHVDARRRIGLLASVVFDGASVAQRVAIGVTFAL